MSLSNRVSVDTDVIFIRNMFVFSTNTNNVPVSTNFIMAIGSNGQMVAADALYNLSTYGVGYLPSTLSSLNGEIVSIGNVVLAGGVIPAQLISVQTVLQSSISSTQGSVDTLSSYVLLNVIPSTVSTFNSYVSSLNSSFQGYVTGTTVTAGDLASTYTAANVYTNGQVSTLSTAIGQQICTLSNYLDVSTATAAELNSLCTTVSIQSNYFSLQIYVLGSNFNALSTSTRLLNESNSTLVGEFETDVSSLYSGLSSLISSLSSEVQYLSSITTNPLTTLGLLSTSVTANWPFFSNIKVSSIDVRAAGTAAAPALLFTSGGDTDTGFFHPADGVIAVATNSGERFRFAGTQLIGCNSDIRLFGSNSGGINAYANSTEPNIQLYTASPTSSVALNMCNVDVSFTTYLTKRTGTGFIANNQLITYANPGANPAIAIHSTGNVGIRTAGDTSNALNVGGSTLIGGQLGVAAAGSAAAPALYFSEVGNDTGFFKPGEGILAVTTNGGECYRFSGSEFSGSNSGALLSLDYATRANIQLGSFCNDNAYAPYLLMSNTSTGVAFQTWCGGSIDGGGALGFTDQLVTRAYPSDCNAIAITSNGTVGIRGLADPTFALTVTGGVRQTVPYIWEYSYLGIGLSGVGPIGFNNSNYYPFDILNGGNTLRTPYTGYYTITAEAQAIGINGATLYIRVDSVSIKSMYTNNNSYMNMSITSQLNSNADIDLYGQIFGGQTVAPVQIRLQYWG